MTKEQYQSIHDFVAARPSLRKAVILSAKILPLIVYISYPLLLLWILWSRSGLLRAILVPAVGFLAVTMLRAGLNWPRPYEKLGVPAISPKDTSGKSFPSRHAACAAVIAITALRTAWLPGILLLAIALLISISRVLAGVHFIRDVVCGLLLGGLIGIIGMFLL